MCRFSLLNPRYRYIKASPAPDICLPFGECGWRRFNCALHAASYTNEALAVWCYREGLRQWGIEQFAERPCKALGYDLAIKVILRRIDDAHLSEVPDAHIIVLGEYQYLVVHLWRIRFCAAYEVLPFLAVK